MPIPPWPGRDPAAYFLFHHATRLKPVNSFFSLTSWARFLKQYREPGTSLKDLVEKVEGYKTPTWNSTLPPTGSTDPLSSRKG